MQKLSVDINLDKKAIETFDKEEEFSEIFRAYYKRVYNYIYYRVNCHYIAEDLTSEVFEAIMVKRHSYCEKKAPFEVWVFAIARNKVNDYFRALKRRNFFSLDAIKDFIAGEKTPENQAIQAEENRELFKALETLDKREKNVVALKFGAQLKNIEIAQILDITESNVGVILYRTMKKLKKEIESVG